MCAVPRYSPAPPVVTITTLGLLLFSPCAVVSGWAEAARSVASVSGSSLVCSSSLADVSSTTGASVSSIEVSSEGCPSCGSVSSGAGAVSGFAASVGGAAVVSTGRSDYPNQINNVLAFPGIFRGAFDVRASDINEEMKMAAAKALADLISDEELSADYIIPKAFDPRVGKAVAAAVAEAARASGVARI